MFRTALLSTLAALGLASAAPAQYYPAVTPGYGRPPMPRPYRDVYEVQYRACRHEPWRLYRVTPSREQARYLERHLERQGFDARVQRG